MKCDLCGVSVSEVNARSYDEVDGSVLCLTCYSNLSSDDVITSTSKNSQGILEKNNKKDFCKDQLDNQKFNRGSIICLISRITDIFKKTRKITIPWAMLCLLSFALGLKSCGTEPLMSSAYRSDPKIKSYNGFYFRGNKIVIDYSVYDRKGDRFKYYIPAGNYWAEIDLDKCKNEYGYYKIHRNQLPTYKIKDMVKLEVVDSDNTKLPLDPNLAPYFGMVEYAKNKYDNKPYVITRMSSPSHENIYLSYFNKNKNKVDVITHGPYDRYIPLTQYPKIILGYPFAVLIDFITLPIFIFAPRIDG